MNLARLSLLLTAAAACTDEAADDASAAAGGASTAGAGAASSASSSGVGGSAGAPDGELAVETLERALSCKLVSSTSLTEPTANQTHTRFNLMGTDLGVPLVIGGDLHLFFGDTMGYKVIWPAGEDPDAVARVSAASVAADASALCAELDFYVTPDVPSVASGTDPSIERDFASSWMTAPPGESLEAYIAQPPSGFPHIPGTFEVPAGAALVGDTPYLFYAGGAELSPRPRATLSFLARWDAPGVAPGYQILFHVDRLADGALGGHFIQIAPVVRGDTMFLFGTGNYRFSGIYLARKAAADIGAPGGVEVFDPRAAAWSLAERLSQAEREAVPPLLETDGVGELSVQYVDAAGLWLAVYQRELHAADQSIVDNRIVLRAARQPEGPWSEPATLVDMADPAFQAAHCCGADCPGERILHCDKAGLYGAYALPFVGVTQRGEATELEVPFVASTWDPYNVVLFRARVRVQPAP